MYQTLYYLIVASCIYHIHGESTTNVTKSTSLMFSEGENIPVAPTVNETSIIPSINTTVAKNITAPVEKNETKHNTIFARKGVELTAPAAPNVTSSSTTAKPVNSATTTEKPPPHKPTVTIGDDEPYAPSHFQQKKVKSETKPVETVAAPGNATEKLRMSQAKEGPDYIVPIVITMLSVPIFIALVMLAYRHGADWWDRRHYRRMDYLIEGIYNN